jgi:superfamily II DNA or RNA helicase
MILSVSPTFTVVESAEVKELSIIRDCLTFDDPDYHIKKTWCKWSTGKIKFMTQGRFPSGLLLQVLDELDEAGVKYKIKLDFNFPEPMCSPKDIAGSTKRGYQIDCAKAAIEDKRGYFLIATAGGKTEIARLIIECIGQRTLYLVHLKELVTQTKKAFEEKWHFEVGVIGDGKLKLKRVTIATVQTLNRILFPTPPKKLEPEFHNEWFQEQVYKNHAIYKWLKEVKVLFIDECHHTSADTFYKVAMLIDAPYRYGMSGTPLTGNALRDIRLRAITGDCIYEKTTEELVGEGYLSTATVIFYEINQVINPDTYKPVNLRKLHPLPERPELPHPGAPKYVIAAYTEKMKKYYAQFRIDYQAVYKRGIVENLERNKKIVDIRKEYTSKRCLILVERIEHMNEIAKLMSCDNNLDFVTMSGKDSSEYRDKVMEQFDSGEIDTIISTIFKEGANLPEIELLIMAGAGESTIITKQRVGRGLRKGKELKDLIIVDFLDNTHRFLLKHANKRIKIIQQDGFKITRR